MTHSNKEEAHTMKIPELIGKSSHIQWIRDRIAELGPARVDVLITGPEGSGKGLVAKCLLVSGRAEDSVLEVQCSVLDKEEAGQRLLEMNSYRSVILHQAECLSLTQQEQVALFVCDETRKSRVFITTNTSVETLRAEKLIHDEFDRMLSSIDRITILPLAERKEDIPPLAKHFIREEAKNLGFGEIALDINTLDLMVKRPWTKNVKEMKTVIERSLVFSDGRYFALPEEMAAEARAFTAFTRKLEQKGITTIDDGLELLERRILQRVLSRFGYDEERCAAFLEISMDNLREKISRLGISAASGSSRG